jgi:hypothetical protein
VHYGRDGHEIWVMTKESRASPRDLIRLGDPERAKLYNHESSGRRGRKAQLQRFRMGATRIELEETW